MNKVVIILARYGSSRLPGKVLKDLGGKTVLAHVLDRCKKINGIDSVCCAVSDDEESDIVAVESERNKAITIRGSLNDVLSRYYHAAKELKADVVMRITSDCPMVDPEVCDNVLQLFLENDVDYASNNLSPTWPHGLDCEVFSFDWLEKAYVTSEKPSDREHVTQYIRNHDASKKINLDCPLSEVSKHLYDVSKHRWTLDTAQDYEFFNQLFVKTKSKCADMSWKEILAVVDEKLITVNCGQDRYEGLNKSIKEDKEAGF